MNNMENAVDKLLNQIDQKKNPCIVGLDPVIEQIPECVKRNIKNYPLGNAMSLGK